MEFRNVDYGTGFETLSAGVSETTPQSGLRSENVRFRDGQRPSRTFEPSNIGNSRIQKHANAGPAPKRASTPAGIPTAHGTSRTVWIGYNVLDSPMRDE